MHESAQGSLQRACPPLWLAQVESVLRPRTLPDSPPRMLVNQFRAPARLCLVIFPSSNLIAVSSLADPSYLSKALPFTRCLFLVSRVYQPHRRLSLPWSYFLIILFLV